jgi:ATP-dependent DNA helicase RecG
VIRTEVRKITGQAESKTISNYPFNALEEAISNAVYPITNFDLQQRRVVSRAYRNRRIGDFLKEVDLTEGKSTGFPIIRDAMAGNGNPEPVFHTDKDQVLFMVTLPCHSELPGTMPGAMIGAMTGTMISLADATSMLANIIDIVGINKVLEYDITDALPAIRNRFNTIKGTMIGTMTGTKLLALVDYMVQDRKKEDILSFLGLTNKTDNFNRYIKPLIELGWLEWTIPEKPKSKRQKYKLTSKGRKLLK